MSQEPEREEGGAPDCPMYYFNGVSVTVNVGDSNMVLYLDGCPVVSLYASHSTLKSMSIGIMNPIKMMEQAMGQPVLTGAEIEQRAKKVDS
ncbi:MAG: hypothetical protein HQL51_05920 [Magnetococcales bacterium]|nr:hypothetical protein [Magnetococcales bacterium]